MLLDEKFNVKCSINKCIALTLSLLELLENYQYRKSIPDAWEMAKIKFSVGICYQYQ